MSLSFHMLGPFEVQRDATPVPLPKSKKARALLAYAAFRRRPIPRDKLVELFFAETRDPRGGLRWVMSRLRAAVGKDVFETSPAGVSLAADTPWLDVDQFRIPVEADASISTLKSADEIVRGEFLADLSVARCAGYEAWRLAQQVMLANQHIEVLKELIRKTLGSPDATRYARRLVNLDVTREESWAHLVESLLSTNQLADARQIQRVAIEQLERDGVRLGGKLEAAWKKYGARNARTVSSSAEETSIALGLKPRVSVLPCRTGREEGAVDARLYVDAIFRACNANKIVSVVTPLRSAGLKNLPEDGRYAAKGPDVDLVLASSVVSRGSEQRFQVELVDAASGECLFNWKKTIATSSSERAADRLEAYLAARMEIDLPIALVSRVREKPTGERTARDRYLLALPRMFSPDGFDPVGAYGLLESALSRQPNFGQACCALSLIRMFMPQYNDDDDQLDITLSLARRSVEICQDDAFVMGIAAVNIAHITHDTDTAMDLIGRALSINPYSVMAKLCAAMIVHYAGDDEACLRYVDEVESTSETDPITFNCHTCRAMAHYQQRNYEQALTWSRKAVGHNPKHVIAMRYMLASLARTGRDEEARQLARKMVALDPSENVSFFERRTAYTSRRRARHLCEGLRMAGLPETA